MILIGMIIGLTLIAFNLQRLFELILLHTLLYFEKNSMKILITKNLSAHRESNRLTSLIYSLTLGSIIFVVVAANTNIKMLSTSDEPSIDYGNIDLTILDDAPIPRMMFPSKIDPVLKNYSSYIEDFGLVTSSLGYASTKHNTFYVTP